MGGNASFDTLAMGFLDFGPIGLYCETVGDTTRLNHDTVSFVSSPPGQSDNPYSRAAFFYLQDRKLTGAAFVNFHSRGHLEIARRLIEKRVSLENPDQIKEKLTSVAFSKRVIQEPAESAIP